MSVRVAGEAKHNTYQQVGLMSSSLPDGMTTFQTDSPIRCCLWCLTRDGCWIAGFTEGTKQCAVYTSNVIHSYTDQQLAQPSKIYVPLTPTRVIFVKVMVGHYDTALAYCRNYGGKLFTPRSQEDIQLLSDHGIDGYLGLQRVNGMWEDNDGNPYTIRPGLEHAEYPRSTGYCGRVKDGYGIVNCSCDRARNFVCLI
ncbi:hypothetical protein Pcinc_037865 [Petrolisthes cinctipes]|uniref:C-type lectin domain-containing protein n=1 Tax=Petrolisthes cinctipes TaxID=88211 RepID=A0AAE1EM55_PETCI|nr:hypothetical protein Pcinc_037865 [Petrolisthes cinctipes]